MTKDNILIYHSLLDSLDVIPVHLATDRNDKFLVAFELNIAYLYLVDFINDTGVVRRKNLSTVVPVSLISVILFRIMGCCHINTCLTSEMTDSIGNLRCRTKTLKEIYFYSVSREDVGNSFCKHTSVVTTVMTYYY